MKPNWARIEELRNWFIEHGKEAENRVYLKHLAEWLKHLDDIHEHMEKRVFKFNGDKEI